MKDSPTPAPVVVSGSIAMDRIMGFEGKYRDLIDPENLDSLSIAPLLNRMEVSDGGVAANIAYTLGLLGEAPVLLGSVGPDAAAYMKKLGGLGVNTDHVHSSKLPTGSFNVITDADENQVGGFYPGAMFDSDSLGLEPWKDSKAIVVVAPHDPKAMRRQVQECAKWDLRLVYDVGQQAGNLEGAEIAEGLEAAEVLILNEYEMGLVAGRTGWTVEAIKAKVPVVVTTLGKDGSRVEGAAVPEAIRVGVAVPERSADPTGAGDAYRAGFLYGLARGWDLRVCAQLGATCGAYAVEQTGTQNHQFSRAEVAARYKATFGEAWPA